MKNAFLLSVIFLGLFNFNTNPIPISETKLLALSSVGLLSTSMFCTFEALAKQLEIWDKGDPHQRLQLKYDWFVGTAVLTGIPGWSLLRIVKKKNPLVLPCVIGASGMFALAGSMFKYSLVHHEEFVKNRDPLLAELRDKLRVMSAVCTIAGLLFTAEIVYAD